MFVKLSFKFCRLGVLRGRPDEWLSLASQNISRSQFLMKKLSMHLSTIKYPFDWTSLQGLALLEYRSRRKAEKPFCLKRLVFSEAVWKLLWKFWAIAKIRWMLHEKKTFPGLRIWDCRLAQNAPWLWSCIDERAQIHSCFLLACMIWYTSTDKPT